MKKMELQQTVYKEKYVHMREVFEDYLQATMGAMVSTRYDVQSKYDLCYSKAVLMVSETSASVMHKLDNSIKKVRFDVNFNDDDPQPCLVDTNIPTLFDEVRLSLQKDLAKACEKLGI